MESYLLYVYLKKNTLMTGFVLQGHIVFSSCLSHFWAKLLMNMNMLHIYELMKHEKRIIFFFYIDFFFFFNFKSEIYAS